MRKNYLLPFLLFICCFQLSAQSSVWYWSRTECRITDKKDSAFLIGIEEKLRKTALDDAKNNKQGPVVMGGTFPEINPFLLTGHWLTQQLGNAHTNLLTNVFTLRLMWNANADSCYVISFSPTIHDSIVLNPDEPDFSKWKFAPAYVTPFFTPLSEYSKFLDPTDLAKLKMIVDAQFAKAMNGVFNSSHALETDLQWSSDSANILPQADMRVLFSRVASSINNGKTKACKSAALNDPYSFGEVNKLFVQWDSTNMVEDPAQPGTFIPAPIKMEYRPKTITIHNTWNSFTGKDLKMSEYSYVPFESYACKRVYISLNYPDLKTSNYITAADFLNAEKLQQIDPVPFEETFKAVFFRRMNIKAW